MDEHYVTAIVSYSDLGTVIACRCGWLGKGALPSNPADTVEAVWNKHLLDVENR